MAGNFQLCVYHVAGIRMIKSGVDGLSREDTSENIVRDSSVLTCIHIHLSPVERSIGVLP